MNKFKIVVYEYGSEDLYIDLPPETLDRLGWSEDDDLAWVIKDDAIILRKSNNDSSN